MRLPVPGPRDVLQLVERGGDALETLLGAVPRLLSLLDQAEDLLGRVGGLLDRIEETRRGADELVARTRALDRVLLWHHYVIPTLAGPAFARNRREVPPGTRFRYASGDSQVLGLKHLYTFGKLAFFDLGGTRLYLSAEGGEVGPESILYLRVDDIGAAYAALTARGVELIERDKDLFSEPPEAAIAERVRGRRNSPCASLATNFAHVRQISI